MRVDELPSAMKEEIFGDLLTESVYFVDFLYESSECGANNMILAEVSCDLLERPDVWYVDADYDLKSLFTDLIHFGLVLEILTKYSLEDQIKGSIIAETMYAVGKDDFMDTVDIKYDNKERRIFSKIKYYTIYWSLVKSVNDEMTKDVPGINILEATWFDIQEER
eukprot:UN30144